MRWTVVIWLALVAATAADETPGDPTQKTEAEAATSELKRARRPPGIEIVPVMTMTADGVAHYDLRQRLLQRFNREEVDNLDLLTLSQFELDQRPQADHMVIRYVIQISRPSTGELLAEMVFPAEMTGFTETEDFTEVEPGLWQEDDVYLIRSDGYSAFSMVPWFPNKDDLQRLRTQIEHVSKLRDDRYFSVAVEPQTLWKSVLRPEFQAYRARLLTEAQRQDGEREITHSARSLWKRTLVNLQDALLHECLQAEYSIDYREGTFPLQTSLSAKFVERGEMAKYSQKLASVRNRSLSYLHPQHTSFVTVALPIPDAISERIPELGRLLAESVNLSLPGMDSLTDRVGGALQHLREHRQFEMLTQMIRTDDQSSTLIHVISLPAAVLEPSFVQLTSHIPYGGGVALNVGEIGGWPVHEFPIHKLVGMNTRTVDGFGPAARSFVVFTDHCVALMYGSVDQLRLLEQVIERDFPSTAESERYGRSAFAFSLQMSDLQNWTDLREELKNLLPVRSVDGTDLDDQQENGTWPGRIIGRLSAAPDQLSIDVSFDDDAMLLGCSMSESLAIVIGSISALFH